MTKSFDSTMFRSGKTKVTKTEFYGEKKINK